VLVAKRGVGRKPLIDVLVEADLAQRGGDRGGGHARLLAVAGGRYTGQLGAQWDGGGQNGAEHGDHRS
jgi:hypothetical protein